MKERPQFFGKDVQEQGGPMKRNWEQEFDALENGEISAASFSVGDLFTMASELAVSGKGGAKQKIYEQYILSHPEITEDDKIRVSIYRADQVRRSGDAQQALDQLAATEPTSPIGQAEKLFVQSEAYLLQGHNEQALQTKEQLSKLSQEFAGEFPPDKPLYYLYGQIYTRFLVEGPSQRVADDLERYRTVLDAASLDPAKKQYSEGAYYDLRGRFYKTSGDMVQARDTYGSYFESAPSPSIKTVAALEYLNAAWSADPTDRSDTTMKMLKYFQQGQAEMQPAYVQACQQEYDFVQTQIAKLG